MEYGALLRARLDTENELQPCNASPMNYNLKDETPYKQVPVLYKICFLYFRSSF